MNTKLECNKFVYNDEDKSRLKMEDDYNIKI